ncbi:MAG TPA: GntR family transcriptional regulator [Armatimonadota bacterium]|nr:GntR family transcriptional regulator [Armatimonadota bacterium]
MSTLDEFHAVDSGETVYLQIREQLREFVLLQAKPGERLPSQRELAKRFKVAPMTVVRAIMDLQHEGLVRRIPGKGTYAQLATVQAETQSPSQSPTTSYPQTGVPQNGGQPCHVAILPNFRYTDIERPSAIHMIGLVVSAVERTVQACGGRTSVIDRQNVANSDISTTLDQLIDQGIHGVVFVGANQSHDSTDEAWLIQLQRYTETFLEYGIHTTVVQFAYDYSPFDVVQFDGEYGAYLATQHLLEFGHRHIAFFSPEPGWRWVESRIRGYQRALRLHGDDVTPHIFYADPIVPASLEHSDDYWAQVGCSCAEQMLTNTEITAVVAANDVTARHAIKRLAAAGMMVPEHLSIVGFDDHIECRQLQLTTIHPPIDRLGEEAARLILQSMDGTLRGVRMTMNLKPSLIVRQTTRPLSETNLCRTPQSVGDGVRV